MRPETERWLRYAEEDLQTARVTLAGQRWSATSVHAQQTAEKALKGLWYEQRRSKLPRTHDLVSLSQDVGYPGHAAGLDELTQSYLLSRYPDVAVEEEPAIDARTAEAHLTRAEDVLTWVRKQLQTA